VLQWTQLPWIKGSNESLVGPLVSGGVDWRRACFRRVWLMPGLLVLLGVPELRKGARWVLVLVSL